MRLSVAPLCQAFWAGRRRPPVALVGYKGSRTAAIHAMAAAKAPATQKATFKKLLLYFLNFQNNKP
jgi:hypothetical protein